MTAATRDIPTAGRPAGNQLWDPYTDPHGEPYHRANGDGSAARPIRDPRRVARGLGWFSIGLGLAECAAPRHIARLIGVDDDETNRNTLFACGVREIASGLGILLSHRPVVPAWARVGGDVMDLALLGRALRSDDSERGRVAVATAAVLAVTVLDVLTARSLASEAEADETGELKDRASGGGGVHVKEQITIGHPREEVYRFWRDFQNLPLFMEHLQSVRVIDDQHSRWTARAPAGTSVEWEAEITEDRPNEHISWRSVADADVPNTGTVRFAPAPGGRGTEIHVELRYDPPGGKLAALVAKLFGEEPAQQVNSDLRRLKQVLETGEVVHSDASIHRGTHPAQPSGARAKGGARR
jgi:uncharacterized membrane protein